MKCAFLPAMLFSSLLWAQDPGFGKNKVQVRKEDWVLVKTEHFEVHFDRPPGSSRPARDWTWMRFPLGSLPRRRPPPLQGFGNRELLPELGRKRGHLEPQIRDVALPGGNAGPRRREHFPDHGPLGIRQPERIRYGRTHGLNGNAQPNAHHLSGFDEFLGHPAGRFTGMANPMP